MLSGVLQMRNSPQFGRCGEADRLAPARRHFDGLVRPAPFHVGPEKHFAAVAGEQVREVETVFDTMGRVSGDANRVAHGHEGGIDLPATHVAQRGGGHLPLDLQTVVVHHAHGCLYVRIAPQNVGHLAFQLDQCRRVVAARDRVVSEARDREPDQAQEENRTNHHYFNPRGIPILSRPVTGEPPSAPVRTIVILPLSEALAVRR